MNHAFIANPKEPVKCIVCNFNESFHGENALCQNCPSIGPVELGKLSPNSPEMALCRDCIEKAQESTRKLIETATAKSNWTFKEPLESLSEEDKINRALAYQDPSLQESRLLEAKTRELENTAISMAKAIDSTIEVYTDMFNADTMSIIDIKNGIDKDDNIPTDKKYDVLAEFLNSRFRRHQELIFERRKEINQLGNEQKAIQQYMMTFANKVRAEIREKLRLSDSEYVPQAVLLDKVHKNKRTPSAKVKFDKKALGQHAEELKKEFPAMESGGIMAMLQALCIQKNIDVERAAGEFRTMVKQGLSMSRPANEV